jgi:prepilin-type N-terminal cleavage/methylation domain-containing protein
MIQSDNQGFTLVEVLVAFAILSITILTGFQIFSDGLVRLARVEDAVARNAAARAALVDPANANNTVTLKVKVERSTIQSESANWTELRPILLRAKPSDENSAVEFETIVIGRP